MSDDGLAIGSPISIEIARKLLLGVSRTPIDSDSIAPRLSGPLKKGRASLRDNALPTNDPCNLPDGRAKRSSDTLTPVCLARGAPCVRLQWRIEYPQGDTRSLHSLRVCDPDVSSRSSRVLPQRIADTWLCVQFVLHYRSRRTVEPSFVEPLRSVSPHDLRARLIDARKQRASGGRRLARNA